MNISLSDVDDFMKNWFNDSSILTKSWLNDLDVLMKTWLSDVDGLTKTWLNDAALMNIWFNDIKSNVLGRDEQP